VVSFGCDSAGLNQGLYTGPSQGTLGRSITAELFA
jgi:hypothetical protein